MCSNKGRKLVSVNGNIKERGAIKLPPFMKIVTPLTFLYKYLLSLVREVIGTLSPIKYHVSHV